MATTLWTIVFCLTGLLLAFSTYAAVIGLAGIFTGTRDEVCPLCHHHYLVTRRDPKPHTCPHGIEENIHHAAWSALHRAHVL